MLYCSYSLAHSLYMYNVFLHLNDNSTRFAWIYFYRITKLSFCCQLFHKFHLMQNGACQFFILSHFFEMFLFSFCGLIDLSSEKRASRTYFFIQFSFWTQKFQQLYLSFNINFCNLKIHFNFRLPRHVETLSLKV